METLVSRRETHFFISIFNCVETFLAQDIPDNET